MASFWKEKEILWEHMNYTKYVMSSSNKYAMPSLNMPNVDLFSFTVHGDDRGALVALEGHKNIPFDIKRVYYIYNTQPTIRRGCHAHTKLEQCLICISGDCSVLVDDGKTKQTFRLNQPHEGLLIKGLIWHELYNFSPGAVVMVLANDYYENTDYIQSYDEFKKNLK
jgi:dTDP-4-dehydrorhamnose 3,5-epimerase-like enzyme